MFLSKSLVAGLASVPTVHHTYLFHRKGGFLALLSVVFLIILSLYRGHSAPVLCVQFDNEKIVSGSADKTIKVMVFF